MILAGLCPAILIIRIDKPPQAVPQWKLVCGKLENWLVLLPGNHGG